MAYREGRSDEGREGGEKKKEGRCTKWQRRRLDRLEVEGGKGKMERKGSDMKDVRGRREAAGRRG